MASATPTPGKPTSRSVANGPGQEHWGRPLFLLFKRHLEAQRGLAKATIRNYLSDLGAFWRFLAFQGITDIRQVNREVLRTYLHWLLTTAKPSVRQGSTGRDYALRSVARRVVGLRAFFRLLVKQGITEADPTLRLGTLKREHRLPRFLDEISVLSLLAAPSQGPPAGLRDRAILELLYASGLRVSEIAGLSLGDVQLDEQRLRVLGKGGKERVVPFGRPARQAVETYLKQGRPALQRSQQGAALFLSSRGNRLSVRSIQKLVKRWAGRAGLGSGVHTHTLRHTFATHLLDGGADLRVVQELLGHSSPSTTEIYTHVTQAQARKAYDAAHPRAARLSGS